MRTLQQHNPRLARNIAAIAAGYDVQRLDAIGETYVPGLAAGCGGFTPGSGDPNLTAAMIAARNGFMLAPKCPTMAAKQFLGLPPTLVAKGATAVIDTQPTITCKILRAVCPSSIAFQFLINDIKVGKWSHFANNEPIPASMIDEQATDVLLDGMTCAANTPISWTVQNTSNADVTFVGGFIVVGIE